MARIEFVLVAAGLVISAAACDGETLLSGPPTAAARDAEVVTASLRSRPPAVPAVLATAQDQDALDGLLVTGGQVMFGGWRTVERPPEAGGPPFEMVGVLRRVPATGGAVEELWTGNGAVNDIASAPGALLFLAYDFNSRTGHLNRIPQAGGAAVELANWFSHGSSHSLASDADVAYWTHSAGAGSFVKRTTVDGTTITLTDSETIGSAADNILFKEGAVYFVSSQAQRTVYGMPADGTRRAGGAVCCVADRRPRRRASEAGSVRRRRHGGGGDRCPERPHPYHLQRDQHDHRHRRRRRSRLLRQLRSQHGRWRRDPPSPSRRPCGRARQRRLYPETCRRRRHRGLLDRQRRANRLASREVTDRAPRREASRR